jgi:integrase
MARQINRLTTRFVAALIERANRGQLRPEDYRRHADGGNLYLVVKENGGIGWSFIYRWRGKPVEIGLGSARDVSLGSARQKAVPLREQLAAGVNPKEARKPKEELKFKDAARALIENMAPSWKHPTYHQQWCMTLLGETPPDKNGNVKKTRLDYCASIQGKLMSALGVEDALRVLKPVWMTRPATARAIRERCERVWDSARARGQCSGMNPFVWRGLLSALLPKPQKLTRGHYRAMPFADVPAFMARLRSRESRSGLALEFCILTATRSAETIGARWDEIDIDGAVWRIPPRRMKGAAQHDVPLSPRALAIVRKMLERRCGEFVFMGANPSRPLCSTTFQNAAATYEDR